MANRNIFAGGSSNYGAEHLKPSDQNDTNNAIQARAAKDAGRNEINQLVLFKDASINQITPNFIEKFIDANGLNVTVDTTNTTSQYETSEIYTNLTDDIRIIHTPAGGDFNNASGSFYANYAGTSDFLLDFDFKVASATAVVTAELYDASDILLESETHSYDVNETYKFQFSSELSPNIDYYVIITRISGTGLMRFLSIAYDVTTSDFRVRNKDTYGIPSDGGTVSAIPIDDIIDTEIIMSLDKGTPTSVIVEVYDEDLDFENVGDTKFILRYRDDLTNPDNANTEYSGIQTGYPGYSNTFTPSENKSVNEVTTKLRNVSLVGVTNIFATFYAVDGSGVPTGAALGTSENILVSSLPTAVGGDIVTFNFSTPVSLTGSTKYALAIETNDTPTSGYIANLVDTTGTENRSRTNGTTWTSFGVATWYIGLGNINLTSELDVNTPQDLGVLSNEPDTLIIIQKNTVASKIGAVWIGLNK